MTTPAAPPPGPVTPTDLVAGVRAARRDADAAEVRVYGLALAWCDAHPAVAGEDVWHAAARARLDARSVCWLEDPGHATVEDLEWFGLPELSWHAPASFAAANAMTTPGGRAYLRDALVIRHRLPRLHTRVVAGRVPVWRARRVAAAVLGEPADVVAAVDAAVADVAQSLGPVQLAHLIEGIRLELHAEAVELAADEARRAVGAHLDTRTVGTDSAGGLASMEIRGDLIDLVAFDHALSQVAAALVDPHGSDSGAQPESLDVRRARAVGILADPATALALLTGTSAGKPSRRVELVVHLSPHTSTGAGAGDVFGPVTHPAQDHEPGPFGRPFLTQTIREWCATPGTQVTVRPVIDLHDEVTTDGYRPTTTQTRHTTLRDRHCVFPRCTHPARSCDTDHVVPYVTAYDDTGPPGQTTTSNLAPTCRHHHRLKTHTGWQVRALTPGTYLWTDPHGQTLLRCPDGTTHDLTDHLAGRTEGPADDLHAA